VASTGFSRASSRSLIACNSASPTASSRQRSSAASTTTHGACTVSVLRIARSDTRRNLAYSLRCFQSIGLTRQRVERFLLS
jgi:hypothetical protein